VFSKKTGHLFSFETAIFGVLESSSKSKIFISPWLYHIGILHLR
jgi:hypothetical protein